MEESRLNVLHDLVRRTVRGELRRAEWRDTGSRAGGLPQVGEAAAREIEKESAGIDGILAALEQRGLVKRTEYRIGLTEYGRTIVRWTRGNPVDGESKKEMVTAQVFLKAFRYTKSTDLMIFDMYVFREAEKLGDALGFLEKNRIKKTVSIGKLDGLTIYRFERGDLEAFLDGLVL
jgi:hypothetical protein